MQKKSLVYQPVLVDDLLAHYWTLRCKGWTESEIFAHFDFLSPEQATELRAFIDFESDEGTVVLRRVA